MSGHLPAAQASSRSCKGGCGQILSLLLCDTLLAVAGPGPWVCSLMKCALPRPAVVECLPAAAAGPRRHP